MKRCKLMLLLAAIYLKIDAQTTILNQNVIIDSNIRLSLTNPVINEGGVMTYFPSEVATKGAAFSLSYSNQGGTSFDGYPSGTVGAVKAGGNYFPGNQNLCGMPVQIQDLDYSLRINWNTMNNNAFDSDDKWWATINVIFDGGSATSEPISSERDFDLVIQQIGYEQDSLLDLPDDGNGRYWYFARNSIGDIKPFSVYINGQFYNYAVRYKFFNYPLGNPNYDQNDKVHVKFIPIDNLAKIPFYDHPLKSFLDCAKQYLNYVNLTPTEQALANMKVADPSLWIKAISGGFEVYDGSSTLGNEFLFVKLDSVAPITLTNFICQKTSNTVNLNWDVSNDEAVDFYKVYRSKNGLSFELLADTLRSNIFIDANVYDTISYRYYVTALDRSFNESMPSDFCQIQSTLSLDKNFEQAIVIYPNPSCSSYFIYSDIPIYKSELKIVDVVGKNIDFKLDFVNNNSFNISLLNEKPGTYFMVYESNIYKLIKEE